MTWLGLVSCFVYCGDWMFAFVGALWWFVLFNSVDFYFSFSFVYMCCSWVGVVLCLLPGICFDCCCLFGWLRGLLLYVVAVY